MNGSGPLLTIREAATKIGASETTVRREIAAGRLAVVRIRRLVRICEADVDSYILRNRAKGEPAPCQSGNVVELGKFASRSAGARLDARLGLGRPDRMRSNLKRRSAALALRDD